MRQGLEAERPETGLLPPRAFQKAAIRPACSAAPLRPRCAGVTDAGLRPRPVRTVAVLGGGLMGSGIATACALAGLGVLLKEVNQKFLDVRKWHAAATPGPRPAAAPPQ
jgi:enoyl-CoA hydratase/3-hydroxyacyl-CoA dehydrogenase